MKLRIWLSIAILGFSLLMQGCGNLRFGTGNLPLGTGFVYSHKITPLTTDFKQTPLGREKGNNAGKQISYTYVELSWDSTGLGDIAQRSGMDTIYFADEEVKAIFGIFKRKTIHVYGSRAATDRGMNNEGDASEKDKGTVKDDFVREIKTLITPQ